MQTMWQKKILSSLFLFSTVFLPAAEIRGIVVDADAVQEKLKHVQAEYKGEYAFIDYVYLDPLLPEEFERIRIYQKTQWKQKPVLFTHKAEQKVVTQIECDSFEEAQTLIERDFGLCLIFSRQGWEYSLSELQIFVERIENVWDSVEVIAPSQDKAIQILYSLDALEILQGSLHKNLPPSLTWRDS